MMWENAGLGSGASAAEEKLRKNLKFINSILMAMVVLLVVVVG